MISCSELAATGGCLVDIIIIILIMITYNDDQDDDVTIMMIRIVMIMLIMIIYNIDQDDDLFSIWWNLNAREGLGLAETLALR